MLVGNAVSATYKCSHSRCVVSCEQLASLLRKFAVGLEQRLEFVEVKTSGKRGRTRDKSCS